MGLGTWLKVAVVALISVALLGFATSPVVHQAAWDGIKDITDLEVFIGDIPGIDIDDDVNGDVEEPDFLYSQNAVLNATHTITIDAENSTIKDFIIRVVNPEDVHDGQGGWLQEASSINYTLDPQKAFSNESGVNASRGGGAWMEGFMNETYDFQAEGPVTVAFGYNVTSYFAYWPDAGQQSGNLNDIDQWLLDTHLGEMLWDRSGVEEVGYEPDNVEIQNLAQQIVGDEENVYEILRLIFQWIYEEIEYSAGHPQLKTVEETLADRSGDCDDQSTLFISLARAVGVPAWMQMGMLYDSAVDQWEHHAWVRTNIPGVGNVTIDQSNDEFLLNAPNRIITYTDTGEPHLMNDFYNYVGIVTDEADPDWRVEDTLTPEYHQASSEDVTVPYSHMRW